MYWKHSSYAHSCANPVGMFPIGNLNPPARVYHNSTCGTHTVGAGYMKREHHVLQSNTFHINSIITGDEDSMAHNSLKVVTE